MPEFAPVPASDNDIILATAILDHASPWFRLAVDAGNILKFDGHAWSDWGTKSEARDFCASIAVAYKHALPPVPAGTDNDELSEAERVLKKVHGKLSTASGQGAVATTMIRIARNRLEYHVMTADLDAEPHVLWAAGNPVDLRLSTEGIVVADQGSYLDVHRHNAPCMPDYDMTTPAWDAFLATVWPSEAVRHWAVRELASVILWGTTSKQHPVLDGPPGTGKSTLMDVIVRLLGSYAIQVNPEMLIGYSASGSAAEEQKYRMLGARLVWLDEPPRKGRQAISQFKDLASGTGTLSASRKYSNQVTGERRYNFVVCQNEANRLDTAEEGIPERLILIPCNGDPGVVKKARDNLLASLTEESPGILARLIVECARHRNGEALPVPDEVAQFREDIRRGADTLGSWLRENFTVLPADTPASQRELTIGALRDSYNRHASHDGGKHLDRQPFRTALERVVHEDGIGIDVHKGQDSQGRRNLVAVKSRASSQAQYAAARNL